MKSQSYPETIPAKFAGNEALESAYRTGWNQGHGIACHNVPKLGERIFSEARGRVTVDEDNIREIHESECYAAEWNARQFSPWEFIAQEFNSADEDSDACPDALWDAYEQGVSDAISADLATYEDSDYGIE